MESKNETNMTAYKSLSVIALKFSNSLLQHLICSIFHSAKIKDKKEHLKGENFL